MCNLLQWVALRTGPEVSSFPRPRRGPGRMEPPLSEPSPPPAAVAPAPQVALVSLALRFWPLLFLAALLVAGAAWWFVHAFHDQGYAPEQPIAFSHRQHAGDLKLDCRFCHFNAERGKHAGVPPMSVCMSCHSVAGSDLPEIQKLASIATTGSYTAADGSLREGGTVHWNRVHKLPDHVYFDHSAHVAANVACQTCHGPVEEMVVVRQHADLTMSWCLDCHRKSNYVGGPEAKPGDPTTNTVGVANNEAIRAREVADPPVVFRERQVKGAAPEAGHAPTAAKPDRLASFLAENPGFAAKVKDLPAWRAADLPDSHRLMNAATNCSTCHQ